MSDADPPVFTSESTTGFVQLRPIKIGGWLIAIAIGLFFSLLQNLSALMNNLAPIRDGAWARLTDPNSPKYHPYWKTAILYEVLTDGFLILLNLIALDLFFKKSRIFPKFVVALLPTIFLSLLVGYYIDGLVPAIATQPSHAAEGQNLILRFVALHVWVPYFLVSKRVKQTFIC